MRFTWWRVSQAAVLQAGVSLLSFAAPLIQMQILRIVEGTEAIVPAAEAWKLAIAMAVAKFAQMVLDIHYRCLMNRVAFRIRCSVVAALFRKSTSLSTGGKATYSSGEIVNMMSNDANRCQSLMMQINNLWMLPINFSIALWLLVDLIGPSAFAGLALVAIVIPPLMTYWMKAVSTANSDIR